jgi:hypothetical protein
MSMKSAAVTACLMVLAGHAAAQQPGGLLHFDSHLADVQAANGRWFVVAGGTHIKDLGTSETDARQALRLIRDLGLNEYGTVGKPQPILEYWLSNGRAPRVALASQRQVSFDLQKLRAEVSAGRWCLRDDRQLLFGFGFSGDDARQALAVLKRYGFNRVAYIGEPVPVMMILLSCPEQPFGPQSPSPLNTLYGGSLPALVNTPTFVSDCSQPPASEQSIVRASVPPPITLNSLEPVQRASAPTEGVALNWQEATVEHEANAWTLVSGGRVLAHLGATEQAAREVLRLVQCYRCTEYCCAGRVEPVLGYFLVDGRAPRGPAPGFQSVAFRPEALTVQQFSGGWIICDGNQPLLACGTNFSDAADALQALQRHQFDHLIRVSGTGAGVLQFLTQER